jgi:hypothetical protein
MRRQVMTQLMMAIAGELKAFEIANVAVIRAVFGNTNENQFMAKSIFPRTQE